ncbi:MAG: DUF3291 domain-containing protein [Dehalococcoidia bacterium]
MAIRPVDPDKTYVAFTSRFALRSFLRVPAFLRRSPGIERQVKAAPGVVGYSLGGDLLKLYFYTLSVWEDAGSLQAFARAFAHEEAREAFGTDMRAPSIFVQWSVRGADLPLTWKDALARQRAQATGQHSAA